MITTENNQPQSDVNRTTINDYDTNRTNCEDDNPAIDISLSKRPVGSRFTQGLLFFLDKQPQPFDFYNQQQDYYHYNDNNSMIIRNSNRNSKTKKEEDDGRRNLTIKKLPETLSLDKQTEISSDIQNLYESIKPQPEDHEKRIQFMAKIQSIFSKDDPLVTAHLFGSTLTGLYCKSSDIDICLTQSHSTLSSQKYSSRYTSNNNNNSFSHSASNDNNFNYLTNIKQVAQIAKKNGMTNIYTISKAKVPICKFFDPEYNLACDININSLLGLQNSLLVKTYMEIDSRANLLMMIIKYWAKRRCLADAGKGGTLSSYTWSLMVINFLQTRNPPILPSLHQIYFERQKRASFSSVVLNNNSRTSSSLLIPSSTPLASSSQTMHNETPSSSSSTSSISDINSTKQRKQDHSQNQQQDYFMFYRHSPQVIVDKIDCSFHRDSASLSEFGAKNTETLAELLYQFFKFYGTEFDYNHEVVSVRHSQRFSKIEKGWHENVDRFYRYFCVEEPFLTSRNMGNSVDGLAVEGLKREFQRAAYILSCTEKGNLDDVCKQYVTPSLSGITSSTSNSVESLSAVAPKFVPAAPVKFTEPVRFPIIVAPNIVFSNQAMPNNATSSSASPTVFQTAGPTASVTFVPIPNNSQIFISHTPKFIHFPLTSNSNEYSGENNGFYQTTFPSSIVIPSSLEYSNDVAANRSHNQHSNVNLTNIVNSNKNKNNTKTQIVPNSNQQKLQFTLTSSQSYHNYPNNNRKPFYNKRKNNRRNQNKSANYICSSSGNKSNSDSSQYSPQLTSESNPFDEPNSSSDALSPSSACELCLDVASKEGTGILPVQSTSSSASSCAAAVSSSSSVNSHSSVYRSNRSYNKSQYKRHGHVNSIQPNLYHQIKNNVNSDHLKNTNISTSLNSSSSTSSSHLNQHHHSQPLNILTTTSNETTSKNRCGNDVKSNFTSPRENSPALFYTSTIPNSSSSYNSISKNSKHTLKSPRYPLSPDAQSQMMKKDANMNLLDSPGTLQPVDINCDNDDELHHYKHHQHHCEDLHERMESLELGKPVLPLPIKQSKQQSQNHHNSNYHRRRYQSNNKVGSPLEHEEAHRKKEYHFSASYRHRPSSNHHIHHNQQQKHQENFQQQSDHQQDCVVSTNNYDLMNETSSAIKPKKFIVYQTTKKESSSSF